jgi:biotin transport system ATP-binding protein
MDDTELLRFDGVSHRFVTGDYGIRDVDFILYKGDFAVVAGPNGAGKTVLMKHANGLLRPTGGTVFFQGRPLRKDDADVKKHVGLIFQNPDTQIVCPTVREELAFGPENLGLPRKVIEKRISETSKILELEDLLPKRTSALSGGEKRKITIAGTITMEPEVLILDEPFTGLDFPGIREVLRLLATIHRRGCTVVVITHEIEKVLAHANRFIIMDRGTIAEDGSPEELIHSAAQYGLKNPLQAYRALGDMTWME